MFCRTAIFLFSFFLITDLAAQNAERLQPEHFQPYTTYFEIEAGAISGADSLIREVSESQFISLGELHNRVQLSLFTSALLDTAASFGFSYFVVETGPYAADKLKSLIEEDPGKVSEFYDEYSKNLFNIYPIPFFTGKADLQMLEAANKNGYDLWGIDQEFAFAIPYLLDELASQTDDLTSSQQKLLRKLHRKINRKQLRAQVFQDYTLACNLKDSELLNTFLESFENNDAQILMIIDSIQESLNIYCLYEEGSYNLSNRTRIAYFKSNFDNRFNQALDEDSEPKVILKMGSYHSGRERSPLNYFDMGNHIQNLSDSLGSKALYLRFLNRYIDGEDMMGNKNYSLSGNFMSVGTKDRWALIDVRPLREKILNKELTGSKFEVREIINYDYIVIMPNDSSVEKHY
jgi:hypothetical protein